MECNVEVVKEPHKEEAASVVASVDGSMRNEWKWPAQGPKGGSGEMSAQSGDCAEGCRRRKSRDSKRTRYRDRSVAV